VSRSSGSAHHIRRVVNTGSKWPPTPTRTVAGHTEKQKKGEAGFQNSTSEICGLTRGTAQLESSKHTGFNPQNQLNPQNHFFQNFLALRASKYRHGACL